MKVKITDERKLTQVLKRDNKHRWLCFCGNVLKKDDCYCSKCGKGIEWDVKCC